MGWWNLINSIPSAFWTWLGSFLKTLMSGAFGAVLKTLWDNLKRSERMNEQLHQILVEEKLARSRPVAGSASRLRQSLYTRKR